MILIDGKKISQRILDSAKEAVEQTGVKVNFSILLANNDEASIVYTELKRKKAQEIGVECNIIKFDSNTDAALLKDSIAKVSADKQYQGIVVQLPLYPHLEPFRQEILDTIPVHLDIDKLSSNSLSKLFYSTDTSDLPATAQAVIECLKDANITNFEGLDIVILNNTNLIGVPLGVYFLKHNAGVVILNKFSRDIVNYTRKADILISATGATNLIDHTIVKPGAVVIDVTSKKVDEKIIGDVIVSQQLQDKVAYLTPVPGGVGPITVACLLRTLVNNSILSNA